MFINELYIYSLWIVLHVFELFKNEFGKNTWLFGLKGRFSGGDFKTIRGVRIIRVFELIGNLPYSNNDWLDYDPIYIKVKFGRMCFYMGKDEIVNFL